MKNKIVIGTRSSKLALWQAEYIADCLKKKYPDKSIELVHITTKGDRVLDVPLAKIGGKGLFTKELEMAMLDGTIDIAVHSLKDMPTVLPEGLQLAVISKRADVGDAFVSLKYNKFADLPAGAKVGTSSLRRKAQILHERPDLQICDLRGNVNTRLEKLEQGQFDAIILAAAGLKRLGYADKIKEILNQKICLPAVGQGALAIEARAEDQEILDLIEFLHDKETACATTAERSFLARVEGGCQVPVGVYGKVVAGKLEVEAVMASVDGKTLLRDKVTGELADAKKLGKGIAEKLLDRGGLAIMQEIGLLTD
ncbi:hydroxymethylbilane synthase [Pectinatus brassicae]|uniref:Porphobilinogen deaminase n=1 Tax=Pectinatus brassicae TaxID=862415 RepID=A0A840UQY6_9FIRM|nr:hydroxymethylbilane synthase [Pectinatus brassicae]